MSEGVCVGGMDGVWWGGGEWWVWVMGVRELDVVAWVGVGWRVCVVCGVVVGRERC